MRDTWLCGGLCLLVLAVIAQPLHAEKKLSPGELRQTLQAAADAHRSDEALMQQLSDVRLVNRVSGAELERLIGLSAGPKSTQALRAIAGEAAFLDPAEADLPGTHAPDIATQKAIVARTIDYVAHTMPTLPNLMATRVTEQFVDTAQAEGAGALEARGGLFLLRTDRSPIAFRDGRETDDPAAVRKASLDKKGHGGDTARRSVSGMTSWGEFGPILGVVLVDAAKGKLGWSRWELVEGKPAAVFQFSVDRQVSHYQLNYCCAASNAAGNYMTSLPTADSAEAVSGVSFTAGYHGRMVVDPETGAVLRITIDADLRASDPIQRASMMVEYGPVTIGESRRTCPTESVSLTVAAVQVMSRGVIQSINRLLLNAVQFKDYHRFGSEAQILTATESATAPGSGTQGDADAAASVEASSAVAAAPPAAVAASGSGAEEAVVVPDVVGMPGFSAENQAGGVDAHAAKGNFTLQVTTRQVDIGLVVTDKRGKPIEDLKADEIELYDNGQRQRLAAFHHVDPGAQLAVSSAQTAVAANIFTNTAPGDLGTQDSPDLLVLLLDESHLAFNDMNRARDEIRRFLVAARPRTRMALYSISEHGFRMIADVTTDHAVVEKTLAAWMQAASGVSQAQEMDTRNRQQFDTVRNPEDLKYVNGNHVDAPETKNTADPQLRQLGDQPLALALESMINLARHFGSVPGHKTLVWISGDSALMDWRDQTVSIERTVDDSQRAIRHVEQVLNEAHIALYAVDASMMMGGGAAVDPSLANASVQLSPVSSASSAPGGGGQQRNAVGRVTAEMQQDTRGIQSSVRELTEATGGRAINKGSDLKQTLDGIERDSESLYDLSFHPDMQADNRMHKLTVKIPGRKDVKLRYRTGYLYNDERPSTKERFQEAVWSPQDLRGIALKAEAVRGDGSVNGESLVRLKIGFAGLNLQQEGSRWRDDLYIFTVERNDVTQKALVSGDTLRLALTQERYATGIPEGIAYQREVAVKGGAKDVSVRVIVVDGNSGKMGSVTVPLMAFDGVRE